MPKKINPVELDEFPQPTREPELTPPRINENPGLPNEEPSATPDENPEQNPIPEVPVIPEQDIDL